MLAGMSTNESMEDCPLVEKILNKRSIFEVVDDVLVREIL